MIDNERLTALQALARTGPERERLKLLAEGAQARLPELQREHNELMGRLRQWLRKNGGRFESTTQKINRQISQARELYDAESQLAESHIEQWAECEQAVQELQALISPEDVARIEQLEVEIAKIRNQFVPH